MGKFLKSSLLSSAILAIIGGMLTFHSEFAVLSISYIIGAVLVAIGVLAIFEYIKSMNEPKKNELDIVYGIVTIIMGILVISNPETIVSIIPFVVGIIVIISSAAKLQYSIELRNRDQDFWLSTMIISILTLLCGVLLVFNPFKGAELFTKTIGILILVYGVLDIISTLTISRTVKSINKGIEEKITEADIVEETTENEKEEKEESIETPKKKTEKKSKRKKEDSKEEE